MPGVCDPVNIQNRILPPNQYDRCLMEEAALWERIVSCGGLQKWCCPVKYDRPPWITMPAQGKRINEIDSIVIPAQDGVDHLVLQFQIPVGYDACLQSFVNLYTGLGFNEGSGQLSWRVKINSRYVKDFGNIQNTMGSLQTPYTVVQGPVRVSTREVISYYVNNATGSGLAGGTIVCGIFGWRYPR
jgi:hypothetical protein